MSHHTIAAVYGVTTIFTICFVPIEKIREVPVDKFLSLYIGSAALNEHSVTCFRWTDGECERGGFHGGIRLLTLLDRLVDRSAALYLRFWQSQFAELKTAHGGVHTYTPVDAAELGSQATLEDGISDD